MSIILLDFDGVLLKNRYLTNYQNNRSSKFVKKHTMLPLHVCEKVNQKYYPKYGHTVTMMNELFGVNTTLEEYNEFVFNKKSIQRLHKLYDEDTKKHLRDFNKIFDFANDTNMSWYIFTNAHVNWVKEFGELGELEELTKDEKIIWPHSLDFLKPQNNAYDRVEKMFAPCEEFIFVDDSHVNLENPSQRKNWFPIHFDKNDTSVSILKKIKKHYDTKQKLFNDGYLVM